MSALPKYAMTYVAYWPRHHVLKVGRAWKWSRIELLKRCGARIIIVQRGTDATWEREALRELTAWFPKAFRRWEDSFNVLWRGRGWTECFTVHPADINLAIDVCIEGFSYATEPQIESGENQRLEEREPHAGPTGGENDRLPAELDRGRPGPRLGETGTDPRGAVAATHGSDDDGGHREAPAAARRSGLPDPVLRPSGKGEVPADEHAQDRPAKPICDRPATASRAFASLRGWGESGRERGADAGAERGLAAVARQARCGSGTARTAAAGTGPADRLSKAPRRPLRRLRALRYCSPPARTLALARPLHEATRKVRGDPRQPRVRRSRRLLTSQGRGPS